MREPMSNIETSLLNILIARLDRIEDKIDLQIEKQDTRIDTLDKQVSWFKGALVTVGTVGGMLFAVIGYLLKVMNLGG